MAFIKDDKESPEHEDRALAGWRQRQSEELSLRGGHDLGKSLRLFLRGGVNLGISCMTVQSWHVGIVVTLSALAPRPKQTMQCWCI